MRFSPRYPATTLSAMKRLFALLVLVLALPATPVAALGPPTPDLWEHWTTHDPASTTKVDHSAWDSFLSRYLVVSADGVNRVAYGRVNGADRDALAAYVDRMAAVPVSTLARPEQMAYWINLYNALTVKVILDHYPVDSILDVDISPGLFSDGPWGRELVEIEGEGVSLDDIEHRILRPIWADPRIHYAVNCASIGCPNLAPTAYTAASLEAMLDAGARAYVNHPRGVTIADDGLLTVSSVYAWFDEDFGVRDANVIAHLKAYAEPALKTRLETVENISERQYDWSLNDAK